MSRWDIRKRVVVPVVCLTAIGAGCTTESPPRNQATAPSPRVTSVVPATPATPGKGSGKVLNLALGSSRGLVRRAIADLRAVGLWDDLTGHLLGVRISSRLGRVNVPTDRHLADAMLSVRVAARPGGECDIMLFPTAMRDDLDRYRTYASRGLLDGPVPTFREFAASILGHELAHCLAHGRLTGERVARRWESKVLEAVQGHLRRG